MASCAHATWPSPCGLRPSQHGRGCARGKVAAGGLARCISDDARWPLLLESVLSLGWRRRCEVTGTGGGHWYWYWHWYWWWLRPSTLASFHRLIDAYSHRLTDAYSRRLTDAYSRRLTDAYSRRLTDAYSRRLTDAYSHRLTEGFAPTRSARPHCSRAAHSHPLAASSLAAYSLAASSSMVTRESAYSSAASVLQMGVG